MQNAAFTKAIKEKLFDLPKHHPKLGKVKENEKSNSKNARNTKLQNLKSVKNDRSGLLVLTDPLSPSSTITIPIVRTSKIYLVLVKMENLHSFPLFCGMETPQVTLIPGPQPTQHILNANSLLLKVEKLI